MIQEFVGGMDFEAFHQNPKTIAAVGRKLQIINESAIRLGDEAVRRCPGQRWADIRGIGNWLRHRYDRVELDTIWKAVRDGLPRLIKAVRATVFRAE